MQNHYSTSRLLLNKLQLTDTAFIQKLVNTEGWIRFIGDRNIHTEAAATAYVEKLLYSQHIHYWVVTLQQTGMPIGVVTLIKREYLPHHDIGFAFLPELGKKGYAFEAASTVLQDVMQDPQHQKILATTIKENSHSIRLLQKMGFAFEKEIDADVGKLHLYACHARSIVK